jgi:hypothetical protein
MRYMSAAKKKKFNLEAVQNDEGYMQFFQVLSRALIEP